MINLILDFCEKIKYVVIAQAHLVLSIVFFGAFVFVFLGQESIVRVLDGQRVNRWLRPDKCLGISVKHNWSRRLV